MEDSKKISIYLNDLFQKNEMEIKIFRIEFKQIEDFKKITNLVKKTEIFEKKNEQKALGVEVFIKTKFSKNLIFLKSGDKYLKNGEKFIKKIKIYSNLFHIF